MKRDFSPVCLAAILVLVCIGCRLLGGLLPSLMPNISPLMAVSFVGAMYLPRRWGWLVGPAAFFVTELAFLKVNYLTGGAGSMFSWWTLLPLAIYALAGGLGLLIAARKSLGKIIAGSIACSLTFYVVANTFSWWHNIAVHDLPGYPQTLAGWWMANTVGLPGYVPTWTFLRNGVAGDLFFSVTLFLVLERAVLLYRAPRRFAARTA